MKFNPTIDLGHVLTALMLIGSMVGMWHTLASEQMVLKSENRVIQSRQSEDRETMNEIAKSLNGVATTQSRMLGVLDAYLKDNKGGAN